MEHERRLALPAKVLLTPTVILTFFVSAALLETIAVPEAFSGPVTVTIKTPLDKPLEYPVNINTTDAKTLMRVPGINRTAARQIVNHRKRNGNYTSLDQIGEFSGIGKTGVSRLRKYLSVK